MLTHIENVGTGPVDTSQSPCALWKTMGFGDVSLKGMFWAEKQDLNGKNSLFFGYEMLVKAGNLDNLRIAAGLFEGAYRGYVFQDSDIYKWLEAVAWELGRRPNRDLSALADQAITLIAAAQLPNGYINSYVQTRESPEPWLDLENGHELYCAGHLFQAAVAFKRALGDGRLYNIACRFADYICSVFGTEKRLGTCGHPEVEMALMELYRLSHEPRYLDLAKFFIDQRGQNKLKGHRSYGPEYYQDHVEVRQVVEAAGHAVRQLYLASGVTDLFLETGEKALLEPMLRLSKDITGTKLYITGGVGSRFDGEAFGDPYELPADQAYCETCAAVASFMWNWRLLLATGESRYADQMERALYNNILSSPALDGRHYFYTNPLMVRHAKDLRLSDGEPSGETPILKQRPEWHDCACCPPNVMRLFASVTHYLSTHTGEGIQIHHYASAELGCDLASGQWVKLNLTTEYPWQGQIRVEVMESSQALWSLSLRIPEWSRNPTLSINGKIIKESRLEKGYLVLERVWQAGDVVELELGMETVLVASNPRIDATRGCLAIQRGPIVYCLEDIDQEVKGHLLDVEIDKTRPLSARWEGDLLNGVMVVEAGGQFRDNKAWGDHLYRPVTIPVQETAHPARLIAIPYFAWGNREIGGMRVWIPEKKSSDGSEPNYG